MNPVLAVVAQQLLMVIAWSHASAHAKADENERHGRYPRSAEVELRNLRNHKFVTSNGWTERMQRPRPEVNVYSRVQEYPSPPPPTPSQPTAATEAVALYRQLQHDSSFYQQHQQQQQQPVVRTAKRIVYYATLPDVVRQPPSPSRYPVDPYAAVGPAGGVPYTADFRQLHDSNRNRAPSDSQRNRLVQQSYGNAYTRDGGAGRGSGGRGGSVTSITTSKSAAAVYDSRYDEPAEFRGDQFYRPPSEFASKYPSWADPFYKSWTSPASSSWGDRPSSAYGNIINNLRQHNRFLGPSSFSSWDREPPLTGGGGNRFVGPSSSFSSWDREPLGNGLGDGGSWENRGSSWDENRAASPWDKELVEVPLKRPNVDDNNENYRPEVAVVHSGVIDVRGDRRSNGSPPPPRFTIVDVDPKPYHQRPQTVQPSPMRHDNDDRNVQRYDEPPRQKPVRYEAYTPVQPPVRYEQQYRPLPPPPSSTRYGQPSQDNSNSNNNNNNKHHSPHYETIKNNINTHQFMTSWTEVSSTQDDVSPTASSTVSSNSTGVQNSHKTATVVAASHANTTRTTPD